MNVDQDYAVAHTSIIDAVARHESLQQVLPFPILSTVFDLQQVSWYACAPVANETAGIVLALKLAHGCLSVKVDDGDSSFYGPAFLMKPCEAAAHVSIELSDHVVNCSFFMVCVSPIMQVTKQAQCAVLVSLLTLCAVAK